MKKILIFFGSYGGGHRSAATAILNYINTNYIDYHAEMVDCIEYINRFLNKITVKAYADMAKKAPWAWKKVYYGAEKGVLSKVSNASNYIMANKLLKIIQKENPEIIISTHPFSSQMCALLKKKNKINCKLATVMTDFHIHSQWTKYHKYVDCFFVSNEQMKKDLVSIGINNKNIFVTGIPISERFLEKYKKNDLLNNFRFKDNIFTILFFAGGAFGLGKDRTFEIFKTLVSEFTNTQIIAISGKNEKMKKLFIETVSNYNAKDRVKVIEFTNQVPELMSISDLVITKPGGLTTSESMVSNVPMILINPIPGQEEENAEFLERNKCAIWLRKEDNIKNMLSSVINSTDNLSKMKRNLIKLAKPNSTSDICKIIIER